MTTFDSSLLPSGQDLATAKAEAGVRGWRELPAS